MMVELFKYCSSHGGDIIKVNFMDVRCFMKKNGKGDALMWYSPLRNICLN